MISLPAAAVQDAQVSARPRLEFARVSRDLNDTASKVLRTEIALANTFIDCAMSSARRDLAMRRLHHARSAYEYAMDLCSRLSLEPEERERVQGELAAIRKRLRERLTHADRELRDRPTWHTCSSDFGRRVIANVVV